jgi:hypothetical protein
MSNSCYGNVCGQWLQEALFQSCYLAGLAFFGRNLRNVGYHSSRIKYSCGKKILMHWVFCKPLFTFPHYMFKCCGEKKMASYLTALLYPKKIVPLKNFSLKNLYSRIWLDFQEYRGRYRKEIVCNLIMQVCSKGQACQGLAQLCWYIRQCWLAHRYLAANPPFCVNNLFWIAMFSRNNVIPKKTNFKGHTRRNVVLCWSLGTALQAFAIAMETSDILQFHMWMSYFQCSGTQWVTKVLFVACIQKKFNYPKTRQKHENC